MKKESELLRITPSSYRKGELRIGDDLIALTEIRSKAGDVINRGDKYKAVRLLEQSKYPGGFVINYKGKEWGFYLGEGAEWWGILKEDKDEDEINMEYLIGERGEVDIGISEFETIPYNIYKVLEEKHILPRKDLVEEVIILENPSSSSRRNIKNTIETAINNLLNKGYLTRLRSSNSILLTPQGKEFFEQDTSPEIDEKIINNEILLRELQKGKTIIVDTPELIKELKKYPNIYFLVKNHKGTYDLGAVYSEELDDWVVARKYRREI
ncbi:MAG: hypothetical protein M0Q88_07070 [Bacilli bacterium]|nr:hypothetical protein [Bacilli bacterium]